MSGKKKARANRGRLEPLAEFTFGDHIEDIAWSPDSRMIAVAEVSGPIHIIHAGQKQPSTKLSGHGFGTTAVRWHPSGDRLASAGQDGKIRIWDSNLWQERIELEGGSAWVEHLEFHPSGSLLASAGGKKIRLWDEYGQLQREWSQFQANISDIAWQPGGSLLAVIFRGGLELRDPTLEQPTHTFSFIEIPVAIAWSPNGKRFVHGNQGSSASLWTMPDVSLDAQLVSNTNKIHSLDWDYSSRFLATNGGDEILHWDLAGVEHGNVTLLRFNIDNTDVTCLAYQRSGFLVAVGTEGGGVCLLQPAKAKASRVEYVDLHVPISCLTWDYTSKQLAVGAEDGRVFLYQVT